MKRTLLFVVSGLMIFGLAHAQGRTEQMASINFSDSSEVNPATVKKAVVRLYPNPSYGKVSVTANTTEPLHFYIFDLEGTLVYQAVLNNKDKKSIENLKKGTYLYDVFEKDMSIEEGKIIIK